MASWQKVLLFIAVREMLRISTLPATLEKEFGTGFERDVLVLTKRGFLKSSWRYKCELTQCGREEAAQTLYEKAVLREEASPKKTQQMIG